MIPGEIIPAKGVVTLNEGRDAIIISVANTGDRPVAGVSNADDYRVASLVQSNHTFCRNNFSRDH